MSDSKCGLAAKTNACKVSNRNQSPYSLTMWQTLSTPFTSLTMLPTVLTHTSRCKCEFRRRIWSKQRPNISGNNAEVQTHSHSYCQSCGSVSKMLPPKALTADFAGNHTTTTTTTKTTTTVAMTTTRRCRSSRTSININSNSNRKSSNTNRSNTNKTGILHSLLLLCILCGKYELRSPTNTTRAPTCNELEWLLAKCA